jgi:predicted ABC-type ATPase
VKARPPPRPSIHVLAGTNGAGKSSIAGALVRARGGEYFNPDEATRRILEANPGVPLDRANSEAWHQGKRLLERAIEERLSFTFETTLGGETFPRMLAQAAEAGIAVRVWYVGLEGADLHLARVRARVAAGGHDIPEGRVRERYIQSRENLVRLLPHLAELVVFDNSEEGDPARGLPPKPRLILHLREGELLQACDLAEVTSWAKPIVAAAAGPHLATESYPGSLLHSSTSARWTSR